MKQYIILFKNSGLDFTRQLFGQVHLQLDEEEKKTRDKIRSIYKINSFHTKQSGMYLLKWMVSGIIHPVDEFEACHI